MKINGMLTVDELRTMVNESRVDTVLLTFTDIYGRPFGKRLDAQFFLDNEEPGTHACDYLLTTDMEMNPVPGYQFANWERGYGDVHMRADLSTLRIASWLDRTAYVTCDLLHSSSHELVEQAPRTILRRQIERTAQMGYEAAAGTELEYYIFNNSYRAAAAAKYDGLEAAGWYLEDYHVLQGTREEKLNGAIRRHLTQSGVPVENSKGEWGKGQHELNIRYADVLEMADRHAIYKQCLKETADRMGLSVTFMAKLDEAQAGSSCHMHLSLWKGAHSAFPGKKQLGDIACSDTFR